MVLGAFHLMPRIHGDLVVADRVRSEVLELKAHQSGCHVSLFNINALMLMSPVFFVNFKCLLGEFWY